MNRNDYFDVIDIATFTPEFVATVRRLKDIGYGRMIQIIQIEWAEMLKEQGIPADRPFMATTIPKEFE